jgi:WD40 repeat protein
MNPSSSIKKPSPSKFNFFSWLKTFVGHKDPEKISDPANISCLSSYLHYLLTGSNDKLIKVWDTQTGMLEFTFHGHQSKLVTITCSESLVFSQCIKKIIIWHFYTGNVMTELQVDSNFFTLQVIKPNSFLTFEKSGKVSLFELEEGFEPRVFQMDSITAAAVTHDLKYLVTAGNSHLRFWDLNDFSLACDYLCKNHVNSVKCSRYENLVATGGKEFNLWRFSEEQVLRFWKNNSSLTSFIFSMTGSGLLEWCGINFVFCSENKEGCSELHCKAPDFIEKVNYPGLILALSSNENEGVIASGDKEGNIVIWLIPDLIQLFSHKETGNLSLLHGFEISINHLVWVDDLLISGSSKGTHSLFGFTEAEDLTLAPIQQFFSIDYLSEFTQKLTLCDFKLNPYKFQPGISMFYRRKGFCNNAASREDLYNYFHLQELQAANEFFFEEDVIQLESDRESVNLEEDVNSVHSVLEFHSDLRCFRCKKLMLESNKWCNECGRTFHSSCFEKFHGVIEEEVCLVCFKSSKTCKEVKVALRAGVTLYEPRAEHYQVGDKVVFIMQAFEEYLRTHPDVPIIDLDLLDYSLPTAMQVVNIEWLWPAQGVLNLVSQNICCKLHLSVLGSSSKTFIYLVESPIKFLINLEEYLEKLKIFQENPTQVILFNESNEVFRVVDLSPLEPMLELSPWKAIVLENQKRISFWESGVCERESILKIRKTNLTRFTQNVNLLAKPGSKAYKINVAYPLSLKIIEDRIASGFYRSKAAAFYDLQVFGDVVLEFFGKGSVECKEFKRIFEGVKKEIMDTTIDPPAIVRADVSLEFQVYLPQNYDKLPVSQEIVQNKFKKLRKINYL